MCTVPQELVDKNDKPNEGLEPSTPRLRVSCSTDWANQATCGCQKSNRICYCQTGPCRDWRRRDMFHYKALYINYYNYLFACSLGCVRCHLGCKTGPPTRKRFVRSGIRTHAWRTRLRPERSALDRSAILTCYSVELNVHHRRQENVWSNVMYNLHLKYCGPGKLSFRIRNTVNILNGVLWPFSSVG